MANYSSEVCSFTFSDFPEDVQICILSFLPPSDISCFACTSKHFKSLCRKSNTRLWYAMCDRRWGSKTDISKWRSSDKTNFMSLFETLSELENLIGFWRFSGGISGDAPLVLFEWGESCVVGSRVSPCNDGSYRVKKSAFIWSELGSDGQVASYMKADAFETVRVSVSFMGKSHVVVEEERNVCSSGLGSSPNSRGSPGRKKKGDGEMMVGSPDSDIAGSPPDRMMYEMYQHFANRTSPGASGERAWRRQRRKERERQGRRKWEPQHLVKIVNCSPTPSRPLQGLWKGICDDTSLDFYLVAYDDIGGVSCRRVGDSLKPFSGYEPVFWTSNATFIETPLSHEEDYLYHTRMHLRPADVVEDDFIEHSPSRLMYINSSYEIVIPELAGTRSNPRHVEGRVWQYDDGTFGFGYLRNNFIVDLKQIAQDGFVLDTAEPCSG